RHENVAVGNARPLSRSRPPRDPQHRPAGPHGSGGRRFHPGGGRMNSRVIHGKEPGTTVDSVDRTRLPVPGPPKVLTFPALEKSTLPNGLRLWTVRHAQVPVIAFLLL